ncbi:hypothetical protein [Caulobacter endophyticus]|uniref:hypothetical protein n=1 Tax=Caulobacter endophyticus TaxID=2172652 RepID=UPI0024108FB3|nr:hypothetical protein [Caulobacter endophyticus]MDG2528920.1 hypothetical protein [Caulobacter endophyticus]
MIRRATTETVEFPVVILGSAVLASLRVERMAMLDGDGRFAAGHDRAEALDVLIDARAPEPDRERLSGVFVRFLRKDFSGLSYGLALALADKRARHPLEAAPRLIATGEIINGGEGRIAAIDGFEAKARQVLEACEAAAEPLAFAFPSANWTQADSETRQALKTAAATGRLSLRPADHLSELSDLWASADESPAARSRPWLWPSAAALAASLLVCAGGATLWWRHGQPLRACEGAVIALDAAQGEARPAKVAAAVEACAAAARARPDDGRILFLTGQVHHENRGYALADKYWKASADLGDPDGQATWGQRLWLSAPDDKAVVGQALSYLQRAADQGSPAAMEIMADIYIDGRATGVDVRKAEAMLARVRAITGKDSS